MCLLLKVTFLGENGTDGGLTREFFTILCRLYSKYIEPTGCLKHNSFALKVSYCYFVTTIQAGCLVGHLAIASC